MHVLRHGFNGESAFAKSRHIALTSAFHLLGQFMENVEIVREASRIVIHVEYYGVLCHPQSASPRFGSPQAPLRRLFEMR